MSEKYPSKELLKLLPQNWPENFVATVEDNEDGVFVQLGKANDLLPSGRVRTLIELFIEDRETNKEALDYIDREMETNPYESQMTAFGMGKKREVVELDGEKFFTITGSKGPMTPTKDVRILYVRDRFLVKVKGESNVLNVQLAQKLVKSLNFNVELKMPEVEKKRRSSADAFESIMTAAYAPMMKEAESIQTELEELEKLHSEGQITDEEYQRRQMELQAKAMAISQKIMGASFAQQMQTFQSLQSQLCPSCNTPVANAKFCPECGTKIPEETKCSGCGTVLKSEHKFCPECGTPRAD